MALLNPLEKFKILVADADQQLATVLKNMLMRMGFSDIHLTSSGMDALTLMKKNPFDFLITDWSLQDLDGIALINYIRCDPRSLNLTLPVVMLTGRAEQSDVIKARDHGITEYVVKPFSAMTVYSRLERIVEFPRHFIVSEKFIGPDRRNKNAALNSSERRKTRITPARKPWDAAPELDIESVKSWLPDFSLKQKLGQNVTLDSIITPAVLGQAQASIDAITSDSLQWIKDDLETLKSLFQDFNNPEPPIHKMSEVTLLISSRAGTFGYRSASKIAYMLYLFCRNKFKPLNKNHQVVIEKHIDVLQLSLASNIHNNDKDIVQVINELRNLETKLAIDVLAVVRMY